MSRRVHYDLETTGLRHPKILQIGAVNGNDEFEVYIFPPRGTDIDRKAEDIHGIKIHDGRMYVQNNEVNAVSRREGLERFNRWLRNFGDEITLIGYNNFAFDDGVLSKEMEKEGLSLTSKVTESRDNIIIVREYKEDRNMGGDNTLRSAAEQILGRDVARRYNLHNLHNAIQDAKLSRLVYKKMVEDHEFQIPILAWHTRYQMNQTKL